MLKPLLRLTGRVLLAAFAVATSLTARADDPKVATFYQNGGYNEDSAGYAVSLAEGEYNLSKLESAGIKNDDISSIKVTPGYKVICYWNDNFEGDVLEITADCRSLGSLKDGWNDQVSSLKVVPNGVRGLSGPVRFKNRNSGLFLDTENNSVSGGTLALQYTDGTDGSQNWLLKEVADGVYNIMSYKSCKQGLDCKDGHTGNGTSIQLVGVTDGNRHQQFIIYDRPGGDYQLVARNSGRVIEVGSSNKASGAKVNLYDNNGSDTQQWSLQAPSITELYIIGGAEGIGWNIGGAKEMQKLADGVFVYRNATFTITEGNQGFKILAREDWDDLCFLCGGNGASASELTAENPQAPCNWYDNTDGKPNYDIPASGSYDITVDLNKHTITVTAGMPEVNDLFLVGNINGNTSGWSLAAGQKSGNKYIFGNVKVNGSFQFLVNGSASDWNWSQRLAANPYNGDDVTLTPGTAVNFTSLAESFKPDGGREPNFVLADGTYDIYVDMDARTVMAVKYEVPEITSVYLYGSNINGIGWQPTAQAEKNGDTFTFRNIFVNEQWFQFVVNGTDVRYRLCPGPYGTDNVALDQCEYKTSGYSFIDTNNKPFEGVGEPSFTLPAGQYDITVDTADGKVTAKSADLPKVEELYMIGYSVNGLSWGDLESMPQATHDGNVFKFDNMLLEGHFQLLANNREWAVRLLAGGYGAQDVHLDLADGFTAGFAVVREADKPQGTSEASFVLPRGLYDVRVDMDARTVSVTPKSGEVSYTDFEIKFWEGPIFEALKPQGATSDKYMHFNYYGKDDIHNYEVYELKVADEIDPIKYASQMALKGSVATASCTYQPGADGKFGSFTFDETKTSAYRVDPAFFDAHTPDVRVPVTTEFWCDHARMEVGMTVKSIYLFFDRNRTGSHDNGETPLYIMASSTGKPTFGAPVQRPLNSDTYSLTLTSGALYDALKGTQTGPITVPFARHHAAEGGYSINLGRYVTTGAEGFTFNVNGQPYSGGGFVFGGGDVDRLVSPTSGAGSALPATPLTFNRIILMVGDKDGGKYNDYKLWLANSDLPDDYKKYGREAGLPMLKVWTGLDYVTTKWADLYDSDVQADAADGDVKYYKFQPVMSRQGNQTNLYYLDLSNGGNGVKISRFREKQGETAGHYDQFNIVDNNGYDISTPYQGSQLMYTGQWWCANPNLVVDDAAYDKMSDEEKAALRTYNGLRFKPVQKTDSRVDLCWDEDATIYGISLFKIMGHGYDVYADAVIERPLYYLYAHTEPRNGSTWEKVEKSAPILFELTTKEGYGKPGYADWTAYNESGKYTTALNRNDNQYYVVKLSDKTLDANDDLNYLLTTGDYQYTPGCTQPFEFVDVTGDQRWTGTGDADKLRPNIWSNYNTGMLNTDNRITLLNGDAEYFKIVLATNPDQTRYQVMSRGISILPQGKLMYDSHHDADHKAEDLLIYPTTDINGSFFWKKGASEFTVTLHFTDKSGNDITTDVKISKEQAVANKLPDQQGFFEDGEFTFTFDLGRYCTDPDWKVRATAHFDEEDDMAPSATYETCGYDVPGIRDLTVGETSKDGDDKGDYYAHLTWTSHDSDENPGLPREYELHSYDVTGTPGADEQNVPDGNRHQTDYDVHTGKKAGDINSDADLTWQKYTYGQLITTGATPINNAENKTVNIGYTVTPVYYYSVPQNEAMKWNDDMSYTYTGNRGNDGNGTAPDGFKVVEQTPEPARNAAVFNGDTTTGIDGVNAEAAQGAAEIYTLSGVRVIGEPAPGIYIVRQGDKAVKTVIR